MAFNSTIEYLRLVDEIRNNYNISDNITRALEGYQEFIYRSDLQNKYSAPMFWIGMYIALASLVCILTMVADLLHGFRSKKRWFPCKYFRVNSAFLTIISVAMKLPVDLTGSMMGEVDKAAKLGSMAFMCTMMANLLPCLATMDNNDLLSNITALSVLVITLVVNVCIQIQTGVISTVLGNVLNATMHTEVENNIIASTYAIFLVVLLMVHVCSSVAILKSKKIIESKYQQGRETASKEIQKSPGEILTVEKLHKHVSNHWIMAGSGSPQFITACFQTTSASGVICLLVTILHSNTMFFVIQSIWHKDYHYDSDYGWSMIVIVIVQYVGIVIGTFHCIILGKSTSSFEGVKKFDHIDDHDVPCVDCWRLPVVTLTTIAVSLPKIQTEEVDSLLESVREGLEYVTVVEKSLNAKNDHVSFQKAAETLWQEIIFDKKWLGNELQDPAFQVNTAEQIVEWFRDKAKDIVCSEDRNKDDTGGGNDDLIRKSISANSMYRITKTLMLDCHTNIDATVGQKELFDTLSSIIADLIAACLTNLPQAITMKCHTSVIEEREDNVKDAAQLLGETTEIIKTLQEHDIPEMNPSDLPFIEKWRAYLGNP
ncbi:hypothetical protein Hanom_Chr00s089960g01798461 [Helianthus anomalus]